MSCPGGAWQAPRRRKSAAERRAQADRAEARTVCRLLKGLLSIEAHRGGQLSRAGRALLSSLQAAPPVVVVAAAAGPVHEGNEGVDNHEGDDPVSAAPADGPPAAAFCSGSCGDLASLGHVAPSAASSSAADLSGSCGDLASPEIEIAGGGGSTHLLALRTFYNKHNFPVAQQSVEWLLLCGQT